MLMVTTVPSMISRFNMNNIQMLQDMGYQVEVACNFDDRSVWDDEQVELFKRKLNQLKIIYYQIDFSRNALNVLNHFKSYSQMKKILKEGDYSFVHCHTPIAAAVSRFACKAVKVKCIYSAHGFHFYKGAPILNWLLYYPIEKICSKYTDMLITINKEDYELAVKKMKAKAIEYIPGAGLDIEKYATSFVSREQKRNELGIPNDAILIMSVGELNKNKNHKVVIDAIARLNNPDLYYCIAGKGDLQEYLISYCEKIQINKNVIILGHRTDITELYHCADICSFTSIREGLGLAALEGMAAGLPLICSDNRGTREYARNGENALVCDARCVEQVMNAITRLVEDKNIRNQMGEKNKEIVKHFDINNVNRIMKDIYKKFDV